MKKILKIVMPMILVIIFLSACVNKNNPVEDNKELNDQICEKYGKIDVDLSSMGGSLAYSQVYDMIVNPEKYVGKIVKMTGEFSVYYSNETKLYYPAIIIQDATACCSNGIEFILEGNPDFPDSYPESGKTVTIAGVFEIYYEESNQFVHLVESTLY